jgi:hypothetical protein
MKASLPSLKRASETIGNINPILTGIRAVKSTMQGNQIDLSVANYFSKTLVANTTFTLAKIPPKDVVPCFFLNLTNSLNYTVTWWSGIKWSNASPPTLTTSGRDILGFFTDDNGATWNGLVLAKDVR